MGARTLHILIVASFCVAARAGGQSAAAPDLRVVFLRSFEAGRALKVSGRDVGTITGSFAEVRDSALVFEGRPGRRVPIAGIDSMWVSKGHGSTGAIVGGVVGLVVAVVAISGKTCQIGDTACQSGAYLESSGITLGGTLVGALIGSGIKSWHLRFP